MVWAIISINCIPKFVHVSVSFCKIAPFFCCQWWQAIKPFLSIIKLALLPSQQQLWDIRFPTSQLPKFPVQWVNIQPLKHARISSICLKYSHSNVVSPRTLFLKLDWLMSIWMEKSLEILLQVPFTLFITNVQRFLIHIYNNNIYF